MKKISFGVLTTSLLFAFLAWTCSKNSTLADTVPDTIPFESLVESYNATLLETHGEIPGLIKGFIMDSDIVSNKIKDADMFVLIIDINPRLKFQVNVATNIAFPETMKNAKIVFIGNQLIIADQKEEPLFNFYVVNEKGTNKTTWIENSINTSGLIIEKAAKGESLNLGGVCWCTCIHCYPGHSCDNYCTCAPAGETGCVANCASSQIAKCIYFCPDDEQ